ncbi:MAG: VacJ family lipoprotein [Rhodobacteraceae bacterium]|nr:VacJ family lipoprotein [Paracoccaceae bacterium]
MSAPRTIALVLTVGLAACSVPDEPVDIHDPFENTNRAVHEFNKSFDQAILRPSANYYAETLPRPIRGLLSNLADHISISGDLVNDILQGNAEDIGHNFSRFAVNSTVGVFGIFDPATNDFGLERREARVGETLAVYGVPEGAYVELPFLGPSTEREAIGRVGDFFTNAFSYVLEGPSALAATGVGAVDLLNDRAEFGDAIDEVFYESADSYAQTRSLYLQNLRFERSGGDLEEQFGDIYDELEFE